MGIVNFIGIICVGFLVVLAFFALISIIKFFLLFHIRKCKYCGHKLDFKGYYEENGEAYYQFHCSHCGSWEKISREEMLRGDDQKAVI